MVVGAVGGYSVVGVMSVVKGDVGRKGGVGRSFGTFLGNKALLGLEPYTTIPNRNAPHAVIFQLFFQLHILPPFESDINLLC